MKRFSVSALALMFVIVISYLTVELIPKSDILNAEISNEFYVIIDAGHGGMDGGTSTDDGILEKDINLSISKKLNSLLKAAGFNTVMLRNSDELIGDNTLETIRARKVSDIRKRLSIAESYTDSLLVSIHQNHYSVEKYSGAQVFFSPNSSLSQAAAQSVQASIKGIIQPENNRQIKKCGSDIYLMYNISTPAIMVECGFLSNAEEAEKLKSDKYQTEISFAIMQGILNYLE